MMIAIVLILIAVGFTLSILLFVLFAPRFITHKVEVEADKLENGVYVPNNNFASKVIPFYSLTDELLKVGFANKVSYAEITVVSWNEKGKKTINRYRVSPNDENAIEIPFKNQKNNIAMFVNKVNDEPRSDTFPKVANAKKRVHVVSILSTLPILMIGTGSELLFRYTHRLGYISTFVIIYVVTALIAAGTYFLTDFLLKKRYEPFIKGGDLYD